MSEVPEVTLLVGSETAVGIDGARLIAVLEELGPVALERTDDGGLRVRVRLAPDPFEELPHHQRALRRFAGVTTHRRALENALEGRCLVSTVQGPLRVSAIVEVFTHTLVEVGWGGDVSEVDAALLEALCTELEGLTILECAEHGALRLEHRLRDRSSARPVRGIVSPENAHPRLRPLVALTRGLLLEYRRLTGYERMHGEAAEKASAAWRALDSEQAAARVRALVDGEELDVIGVDGSRVLVRPHGSGAGPHLLAFEMKLQDRLEPTLEVHAEPRPDALSIRLKKGSTT